MIARGHGRNGRVETTVEHLESLSHLEERIQRAVDLIVRLKAENRRMVDDTARLQDERQSLESQSASLQQANEELLREGNELRAKAEEWKRFQRDRDEIRSRIDGMLAKFEELEI